MARYTGPRTKISRRFGEPLFGPDKYLDRRNFPPGQHGPANKTRRKKVSDYGNQLLQKQKAKQVYGMLEKQFRRFYEIARARKGNTADLLLQICESRLDNVVYRLGLAPTRAAARQLVVHRHVAVDGKVVGIPSALVRPGQKVGIRERDRGMEAVADSLKHPRGASCDWLEFDEETKTGTFARAPEPSEVPETIDMQTVVELYSR
ncbi:MAG: 30S ribosomal protein S4 [Kiritimatiellae bacterium]|nr:30S ribosomal protein S4 [Kiritimatiellia bacterium]MBR1837636.1 30S ribosomal protein S4 [Kiritimatiellia bacterium]